MGAVLCTSSSHVRNEPNIQFLKHVQKKGTRDSRKRRKAILYRLVSKMTMLFLPSGIITKIRHRLSDKAVNTLIFFKTILLNQQRSLINVLVNYLIHIIPVPPHLRCTCFFISHYTKFKQCVVKGYNLGISIFDICHYSVILVESDY